jgi:hypothetical protein
MDALVRDRRPAGHAAGPCRLGTLEHELEPRAQRLWVRTERIRLWDLDPMRVDADHEATVGPAARPSIRN